MRKTTILLTLLVLSLALTGCSPGSKLTNEEKIQAIDTMADETLQRLYTEKPATKDEIKESAGYAAFSNANVNIIFAGIGGGYGVVVDNTTGDKTYMKMGSGGLGFGIGVKDFRQVMVFNTKETTDLFLDSGWTFGGHADAAAKAGDKGGAVGGEGAMGQVKVYSMTDAGLALQAMGTGTKYYKDKDLN
ncbi:MAG: YSC84-related protein [Planctomycetota bacterium]|jgi:lipid-binding SYLF domain-containing protein